ncbi:hypothetical protein GCM10022384_11960 [Streptomyces marokkonensis]|uniref:Uncharacterized protein n=1 Tax=Streptomyces marokkonensis TaxID=324855 RepID=A0ABP7P7P6_9ACTN
MADSAPEGVTIAQIEIARISAADPKKTTGLSVPVPAASVSLDGPSGSAPALLSPTVDTAVSSDLAPIWADSGVKAVCCRSHGPSSTGRPCRSLAVGRYISLTWLDAVIATDVQ